MTRSTKQAVILSGLAMAVLVGVAWTSHRATQFADAKRHEAENGGHQAAAELSSAQQRLKTSSEELARARATRADADRLKKDEKATSHDRLPSQSATRSLADAETAAALERSRDPYLQLAKLARRRAYQAMIHRPLFDLLGLSAVQIDAFLAIAVKLDERRSDIRALENEGIITAGDPVAVKLRAEAQAGAEGAYRELLGAAALAQLREYDRSFNARDSVMGFAGYAVLEGCPVGAAQLEQLVSIIANSDSDYRHGEAIHDLFNNIEWDDVVAKARPLMNDEQWRIFTTVAYSGSGYDMATSRLAVLIAKAVKNDDDARAARDATRNSMPRRH